MFSWLVGGLMDEKFAEGFEQWLSALPAFSAIQEVGAELGFLLDQRYEKVVSLLPFQEGSC